MNKILFLIVIFFTFSALAQESILISGGFGGPVIKVININGENAVRVGGRGGWIINHSFVLAGGGIGYKQKNNDAFNTSHNTNSFLL
jgi:hypothetical protein